MFCTNCGNKLNDSASFCTGCGQKIETLNQEEVDTNEEVSKEETTKEEVAKEDTTKQEVDTTEELENDAVEGVEETGENSILQNQQTQPQTHYQKPQPQFQQAQPQYQQAPMPQYQQAPMPKKKAKNWLGMILTFILPIPVAILMVVTGAPLWLWLVGVVLFIINFIMQIALFKKGVLPGLLAVLISVSLLSLSAIGLFMIGSGDRQGQSLRMLFRQPPVEYTQADFDSYINKTGVVFSPDAASAEDIMSGNYTTVNPTPIDDFFTNEELTAMINASSGEDGLFQNLSMRFLGNDRMEVSATISPNLSTLREAYPEIEQYEEYLNRVINQRVYMRTTLIHTEGNNFEAEIERLSIGRVPLPVGIVNRNMEDAGTFLNEMLSGLQDFEIEEFYITSEGIHFKGTIPQEIRRLGYMS